MSTIITYEEIACSQKTGQKFMKVWGGDVTGFIIWWNEEEDYFQRGQEDLPRISREPAKRMVIINCESIHPRDHQALRDKDLT